MQRRPRVRSNGESKPGRKAERGRMLPPRVVMKFQDWVAPPEDLTLEDLGRLKPSLAAWLPGTRMTRLFSQSPKELHALTAKAVDMDPTYQPVDLASYCTLEVPAEVEPDEMVRSLMEAQAVEQAYVEPGPVEPPLVNAADDPHWMSQGYLRPAPDGIDATFAWTVPGGDGAQLGFVDLEQGWMLDHEDLLNHGIRSISGINKKSISHGTSVLGEVAALDNAVGCVGITPKLASVRVVSQWLKGGGYGTAQPILDAIIPMGFGDVLLLEAQTWLWSYRYLPVEIEPAVFDVVRLATALGLVVVEAAGNGSIDLDTVVDYMGRQPFNRAAGPAAGFKDSGAIIVGAASSSFPHTRLGFSCYGSRIDCYGWGENVESSKGTARDAYTSTFGGTSSASAIIAGAALSTQGMAAAAMGFPFNGWQLRAILSNPAHGTPSASPTDRIGVMPDLKAIARDSLNAIPAIYLRDHVGDTGAPHSGPLSASPDLILRPALVANAEAEFGELSGTANDATLGFEAEAGQDNYLYIRARNRGGAAATGVVATVYWAEVATLITPEQWNLIGSVTLPSLPTGDILTVFPTLTWPRAQIAASGPYCLVGLLGTAADPAPVPADFMNFDNFLRFIRENKNITWRSFNVVGNATNYPPDFVRLPFLVTGAPDIARRMALEVVARLPQEARVFLEMSSPIRERMGLLPPRHRVSEEEESREPELPINPTGHHPLGEWLFPALARVPARLMVSIPEKLRQQEYEIAIRQLYENQEVGRITWRLVPGRKPLLLAGHLGHQPPGGGDPSYQPVKGRQ